MKVFNVEIKLKLDARWPFTHFKVHSYTYYKHVVWGKMSLMINEKHNCEDCNKEMYGEDYLCDECFYLKHCECGQKLEDSYGSPGDGFCIQCR